MIRLVSETDTEETHVTNADSQGVIRLVLSYADKGMWDFKLTLPNGTRYSVKQLVRQWHLSKYVQTEEELG
jgi:hypothetical protein